MKAEEILYNYDTDLYCDGAVYSESGYTSATVIKAMDEYAKERAMSFAEWIISNAYALGDNKWMYCIGGRYEKTTAELYDIFNNENQEK